MKEPSNNSLTPTNAVTAAKKCASQKTTTKQLAGNKNAKDAQPFSSKEKGAKAKQEYSAIIAANTNKYKTAKHKDDLPKM